MNRGDRLVFSNGIVGLTLLAIVLLVVFNANVNAMIPLYAVGVFTSFTISQAGMVVHWHRLREVESGWRWRATLNGVGAAMTAVVSIVIVISKFVGGAYIVVIAIPLLVLFFRSIKGHYDRVAGYLVPQTTAQLRRLGTLVQVEPKTTVVLFVSQVNEIVARSLYFAKALSPQDVRAVTVKGDDQRLARLEDQWNQMDSGIPLDVVHSPYRELVRPAVQYVRSLEPGSTHMVIVVIPEFVVEHWWEAFLHNQSALRLRGALFLVPWVIVVSIPFHIGAVGGAELDAEGLFKGGYAP